MTAVLLGLAAGALVLLATPSRPIRPPDRSERGRGEPPLPARAEQVLDRLLPGRRCRRRDRQLPDALDRLGSSLRAGDALGPAVVSLAGVVPDPLGTELRVLARRLQHGRSVADALAGWSASEQA